MKNLLTLHEAIALALLSKENRTSSFDEVAKFIDERNLFPIRKAGITLSKQVMLRSVQSKGRYAYLFEQVASDTIKLRNLENHEQTLFDGLTEDQQQSIIRGLEQADRGETISHKEATARLGL
jgi:hypothetical protein